MLFYEPSTRTHSSFEVAAKRLSADVTNFDVPHSSIVKGESVRETIDTLRGDAHRLHHRAPRAFGAARGDRAAGAGQRGERRRRGARPPDPGAARRVHDQGGASRRLDGRRVLIVGDILHSRVARSTTTVLLQLGVQVAYLGPGPLVPATGPEGVPRFTNYDEAMKLEAGRGLPAAGADGAAGGAVFSRACASTTGSTG